MKNVFLTAVLAMVLSCSIAQAVVYQGAMDNRAGLPFVPGFTGHSKAWVTGGDPGAGLRLEWQADNETTPGSWTYTYRLLRNTAKNKGFAFFDIETAADFTTANITSSQVLSATDATGAPIPAGLASITISGFQNFTSHHDFSNAAVSEVNSQTVLSKFDLSHYSGDPGRVAPGKPGSNNSATPSVGPVPHPFSGIRVTFPGSFAELASLGYNACEWSFRVVSDRVPMWGHFFGWSDQTTLSPYWYADIFNNHIDDPIRLTLAPIDSLTGADPYQGWILVPGSLPTVLSTLPLEGAVAAPVTEPVSAVFSGVMDPRTIKSTTFSLAVNGIPVAGRVSYDPDAMTATFTPNSPLVPNTSYTATISTGAKDLAGNALTLPKSWGFTTAAPDVTPPTVTATIPGNTANFVGITTPITASFSEEIDPFMLTANFTVDDAGDPVSGTVSYIPAIRTAVFTPSVPLANNTTYTVTIATGIRDRAGNAMAVPVTWSFTTIRKETVLPLVTATVPAARSLNVQINSPIIAIFSEPMDPATINAATFKLSAAGVPVAGTVSYDPVSNTASFTPAEPALAFSTAYSVSIFTAVSDLAGNHLPLVNEFTFTTAAPDTVPPTVTATSPSDGSNNVPVAPLISATFSEQIDPATLVPASITVTGQSFLASAPFAVSGTVSLSSGGISLPSALFTLAGPLPMGTVYSVRVTGVKDLTGNLMTDKIWSFTTMPDGILIPGESGVTTIADALKVLRIAVNLIPPTQDDKNHGDVAPLGPDGKPQPDGNIDIQDALVILRKAVGLVSW
ncbi:MAG: Ig-like domain-containing protein [Desulfuromonadales bacterium]|nr:Ig-like domain-containing protein [Desulfuromonadales bacterium]